MNQDLNSTVRKEKMFELVSTYVCIGGQRLANNFTSISVLNVYIKIFSLHV